MSHQPRELVYDAGSYWWLSDTFTAGKPFSLYNFPLHYRAYLFPLGLFVVKRLARVAHVDPMLAVAACNALCMVSLHLVLIPRIWHAMTGERPRAAMIWLAAIAGLFLWRGHLIYPMTDLPTLTALIAAVVCLHGMRSADEERKVIANGVGLAFFASVAGVLRPAYLPAMIAVLSAGLVATRGRRGRVKLGHAAVALSALLLLFGPQVALNVRHAGLWSPLPAVKEVTGKDLSLQQLGWGLAMQRYETDVTDGQPRGGVPFGDPVGKRLLGSRQGIDSYGQYLGLMLQHPLDAVSIYARHLFNGCDLWYATVYVDDPRAIEIGTALVNVLLWMLTLLQCRRSLSWSTVVRSSPYSLILLTPLLTVIPAAVETRFFWPLHLLANAVALYGLRSGRELADMVRAHWRFVAACLCIWVTLSRLTYAEMPL